MDANIFFVECRYREAPSENAHAAGTKFPGRPMHVFCLAGFKSRYEALNEIAAEIKITADAENTPAETVEKFPPATTWPNLKYRGHQHHNGNDF